MILESASYVAGIVAAIAALVSVYFTWKHHRKKPPEVNLDKIDNSSIADDEGVSIQKVQPYDPLKEWNERKARVALPNNVPESLSVAFEAAKTMWNKPARDNALVDVANKALDIKRFDFAISVAAAMWNAHSTDSLLTEIVLRALDHGDLTQAKRATEIFFNLPKKDKAITLIVERANS